MKGRLFEHYRSIVKHPGDPLDLLPELDTQRTMLALAIERLQSKAAGIPGNYQPLVPFPIHGSKKKQKEAELRAKAVGGGDRANDVEGVSAASPLPEFYAFRPEDVSIADLEIVLEFSAKVVDTAARIITLRNQTALTKAEITYMMAKMKEVISEFIPDVDRQRAFIDRLISQLPAFDKA
jgi:hypothetical protein